MSRINHNNIDKWLFDYVEGNLTPAQERELNSFIQQHPEYEIDLDSWNQSTITEDKNTIPVLAYEAELLSIAQPIAWKRYAAVAALALLTGGSAVVYMTSNENTTGFTSTVLQGGPQNFSFETNIPNENRTIATTENTIHHTSSTPSLVHTPVVALSNTESTLASSNSAGTIQNANRTNVFATTSISTSAVTETPLAIEENESAPLMVEEVVTISEGTQNNVSMNEEVMGTESEMVSTPGLVHIFDLYRPEIVAEEFGTIAAANAVDILKSDANRINTNTTASNQSNEPRNDGSNHTRRKRFYDNRLGFINNRDHQLLQPGMLNTAEYAAFASTSVSPSLSINARNQWSDADHSVNTAKVFYSQFNKKMKSAWGFGISGLSATNGGYTGFTGSFLFSPKFRINKFVSIEPGVMASIYQNDIHSSRLNENSRLEPVRGVYGRPLNGEGMPRTQRGFDVHFSTLIQTKHFFTAIGIDNMLHPALGVRQNEMGAITSTPTRFKAVIGTDFKRLHESKITLSPQISFMKQGKVSEIWGGLTARYGWMSFGAAASQNGQVLATAGIHSGRMRLLYQFDVTQSHLNQTYYASHELSLRMSLAGIRKKDNAILNSYK